MPKHSLVVIAVLIIADVVILEGKFGDIDHGFCDGDGSDFGYRSTNNS